MNDHCCFHETHNCFQDQQVTVPWLRLFNDYGCSMTMAAQWLRLFNDNGCSMTKAAQWLRLLNDHGCSMTRLLNEWAAQWPRLLDVLALLFFEDFFGNLKPLLSLSHSSTSTPCFSSFFLFAWKYFRCASLLYGICKKIKVELIFI